MMNTKLYFCLICLNVLILTSRSQEVNYTHIGCFVDYGDFMYMEVYLNSRLSNYECAKYCSVLNAPYFATSISNGCSCLSGYYNFTLLDLTHCMNKCPNDNADICGGNLYGLKTVYSTKFNSQVSQEIGCMINTLPYELNSGFLDNNSMTVEFCVEHCTALGYKYGGLFYATCGCGNSYKAYGLHPNKTLCDKPCKGNTTQKCGGNDLVMKSFFKINYPSPVIFNFTENSTNNTTNTTLSIYGNHYGSRGCYTLKAGVKVSEFGIRVKNVDVKNCIVTCDYFNYTYSMVAKYTCYCTNVVDNYDTSWCNVSYVYTFYQKDFFDLIINIPNPAYTNQLLKIDIITITMGRTVELFIQADDSPEIYPFIVNNKTFSIYKNYSKSGRYSINGSIPSFNFSESRSFDVFANTIFNLECPSSVYTGESFTCVITQVSTDYKANIVVDFGDGENRLLTFSNKDHEVNKKFTSKGAYLITIETVDKYMLKFKKNTTVLVTGPPVCTEPIILIEDQRVLSNPLQTKRSALFTVNAEVYFQCSVDFTDTKEWKVEQVDPNTGAVMKTIDFADNSSRFNAELAIQPNTLGYGVYRFSFIEKVFYYNKAELKMISASEQTYLEIVPSGVGVFGFGDMVSEIVFGINQDVNINPGLYSVDYDSVIDAASLNFTFYCRMIDWNETSVFPDVDNLTVTKMGPLENLKIFTDNDTKCLDDPSYVTVSNNKLLIYKGGLQNVFFRKYQFKLETTYLNTVYSQVITVFISNNKNLPFVSLKCRFESDCKHYPAYQKINPSSQLIIDGSCMSGCETAKTISYRYNIYRGLGNDTFIIWAGYTDNYNYVLGETTSELTLTKSLFENFKSVELWRVQLDIIVDNARVGSSSITLKPNSLPYGGTCSADFDSGIALDTYFIINCKDWTDLDGTIASYEFYLKFKNQIVPIALNFNSAGFLRTKLPPGPDEDSSKVYVFVKIVDDSGGFVEYDITSPIYVYPNHTLTLNLLDNLASNLTYSTLMKNLNSGNLQTCSQNILILASTLNSLNYNMLTNSGVKDKEALRNLKAKTREILSRGISSLTMSDSSSLKLFSSMLCVLCQKNDEISRSLAENSINLVKKIVNSLSKLSIVSSEELNQISTGVFDGLANLFNGLNGPLYSKTQYLLLDSNNIQTASLEQVHKKKQIELKNSSAPYEDKLVNMIQARLSKSQSTEIKTDSVEVKVSKNSIDGLKNNIESGNLEKILFPAINELNPNNDSSKIFYSKTCKLNFASAGLNGNTELSIDKTKTLSLDIYDSAKQKLSIQNQKQPIQFWIPKDPSLLVEPYKLVNAKLLNGTQNQSSEFITHSFKINYSNSSIHIQLKPVDKTISYLVLLKFGGLPKLSQAEKSYDLFRILCESDLVNGSNSEDYYLIFANMNQTNGFKGVVGMSIRELNNQEKSLYCNDSNSFVEPPVSKNTVLNFTSDFWLRVFLSGCYFYDQETHLWSSKGVEVLQDTNTEYTHCVSEHLTEFAGGFIVVPAEMDFNYIFKNASFLQNPIIYSTVIVLCVVYVIAALVCRYFDIQDRKKIGLTYLSSPFSDEGEYFYEITLFTGTRSNAGTKSKVFIVLHGQTKNSMVIPLEDSKRKTFSRGSVDTFVVSELKSLGDLYCIRVWHDNSGVGDSASWYLKHVIIRDLQTNERYLFINEKWLALEKDDGRIDRVISACGDKQKKEFKYLVANHTKRNMSDNHLWLSVFTRPVQSTFSRLDRLTCCFVLLNTTMLLNILYYDIDKSANPDGLKIGPFVLTPQQIGIGIITNLILFPPSFILIQLFRKSRARTQSSSANKHSKYFQTFNDIFHIHKIRKVLKFQNELPVMTSETLEQKTVPNSEESSKSDTFPWWFKIIAYILSFIFSVVSIVFIIFQGISFGDEKVGKWLTSLAVSFLTSVFLTQPLHVTAIAVLLAMIFKKPIDDNTKDLIYHETNKESIQKGEQLEMGVYNGSFGYQLMSEEELEIKRKERLKELKIQKIIKDVCVHSLFLLVLYFASYSNRDPNSYFYQDALKKSLIQQKSLYSPTFKEINKVDDIWTWLQNVLIPSIKAQKISDNLYHTSDYSSFLIENPIIRQLRIQNNSCRLPTNFLGLINHCDNDISVFNTEKSAFDPTWSAYSNLELADIQHKAFRYQKSEQYHNEPYFGAYNSYIGGGYIYEMSGETSEIVSNLTQLKQNSWIDRQTRAVFVEFSAFNPNLNLFSYCVILFEFLPSGSLVKSATFSSLNLLKFAQSLVSFELIFSLIYIIFISVIMVKQILQAAKLKKEYFKSSWSYIDWIVISFSWAAFSIFLYRLYATEMIMKNIKNRKANYINLQTLNYWNDILNMCLGFCAAFGTLKFFKLLKYNKVLAVFMQTIKRLCKELVNFGIVFMAIFLAFNQFMFLIFHERIAGFSTIAKSFETCFQIILGKVDFEAMYNANRFFGSIVFVAYNIFVVFILISFFISILIHCFNETRSKNQTGEDLRVLVYLVGKIKALFGKNRSGGSENLDKYNDGAEFSMDKLNKAVLRIDRIIKEPNDDVFE